MTAMLSLDRLRRDEMFGAWLAVLETAAALGVQPSTGVDPPAQGADRAAFYP